MLFLCTMCVREKWAEGTVWPRFVAAGFWLDALNPRRHVFQKAVQLAEQVPELGIRVRTTLECWVINSLARHNESTGNRKRARVWRHILPRGPAPLNMNTHTQCKTESVFHNCRFTLHYMNWLDQYSARVFWSSTWLEGQSLIFKEHLRALLGELLPYYKDHWAVNSGSHTRMHVMTVFLLQKKLTDTFAKTSNHGKY